VLFDLRASGMSDEKKQPPTLLEIVQLPSNWSRLTRAYQAAIEQALMLQAQARLALFEPGHRANALTAELIDVLAMAALVSLGNTAPMETA
jgi:hypothetical protein